MQATIIMYILVQCDGGGAWSLALPLGSEERFDWTASDSRRRRSMSPDVVPNLFRPRKESLVNVDFDHDRAASGLPLIATRSFHGQGEYVAGLQNKPKG